MAESNNAKGHLKGMSHDGKKLPRFFVLIEKESTVKYFNI